jgi:hypothetical protein
VADVVDIILRLRELRAFLSGTDQASKAVAGVGTESDKAGKKAAQGWKGIAKWAGGAAVMYGATKYIKGAVGATEDLAKNTLALQRQTNLDTQSASEWVGVLKERGIQTKTFQVGLKTLSKQMETSRLGTQGQSAEMKKLHAQYAAVSAEGGKKAPAALVRLAKQMDSVQAKGEKSRGMLARLHISLKAVRTGNTSEVLLEMADALQKIKNPAERSTAAQTLLGKSGIALLPVLMKGRKGIEEMLGVQKKYGNYISGKNADAAAKLIEQQRKLNAAMEGAKVQLGTALMPVLIVVAGLLVKFANFLEPITKHVWLLYAAIGALTLAFVAYKIGCVIATIASWGLEAAQLALIGVWVLVVVAIIAVVAGIIYLYKHWSWFHGLLIEIWNWLKKNWPLLLPILFGPFGLAAMLIIKHFGAIKTFVLGVLDTIKNALRDFLNYVEAMPARLLKSLAKLPGGKLLLKGLSTVGGAATKALGYVGLAGGGAVTRSGGVMVGEQGPELLNLPIGARVTPLQGGGGALAGAGGADIIIPVYLDGREITRSVARWTGNKLARR